VILTFVLVGFEECLEVIKTDFIVFSILLLLVDLVNLFTVVTLLHAFFTQREIQNLFD